MNGCAIYKNSPECLPTAVASNSLNFRNDAMDAGEIGTVIGFGNFNTWDLATGCEDGRAC